MEEVISNTKPYVVITHTLDRPPTDPSIDNQSCVRSWVYGILPLRVDDSTSEDEMLLREAFGPYPELQLSTHESSDPSSFLPPLLLFQFFDPVAKPNIWSLTLEEKNCYQDTRCDVIYSTKPEFTGEALNPRYADLRGLSQSHLRHLYKACVVPVMTHASAAWWTGKKIHEKELDRETWRISTTVSQLTNVFVIERRIGRPATCPPAPLPVIELCLTAHTFDFAKLWGRVPAIDAMTFSVE
ncbi:hypothetical protein B0H10DRAFT_1949009 [Mycena sp. CBHHK59/15]|nr:hypothetical protein B0H10DRAFT_1949009 [Mycena sp. CBHHK59/15]